MHKEPRSHGPTVPRFHGFRLPASSVPSQPCLSSCSPSLYSRTLHFFRVEIFFPAKILKKTDLQKCIKSLLREQHNEHSGNDGYIVNLIILGVCQPFLSCQTPKTSLMSSGMRGSFLFLIFHSCSAFFHSISSFAISLSASCVTASFLSV